LTIGNNIKKYRIAQGLTQKQLGERCGMADSAIRRYESDRGNPTEKTLSRIAEALGIAPWELLPGNYMDFLEDNNENAYWDIVRSRLRAGITTGEYEKRKLDSDIRKTISKRWNNEIKSFIDSDIGFFIIFACVLLNKKGQSKALALLTDLVDKPEYSIVTEWDEEIKYLEETMFAVKSEEPSTVYGSKKEEMPGEQKTPPKDAETSKEGSE